MAHACRSNISYSPDMLSHTYEDRLLVLVVDMAIELLRPELLGTGAMFEVGNGPL